MFVLPIVTLASTIADDFPLALLNALITARKWLAQINADNATLLALANILQSWSDQVKNMPKKLQTTTQTDLDWAQTYLHGLQQIARRPFQSGRSTVTHRSKRPGHSEALSSPSG